ARSPRRRRRGPRRDGPPLPPRHRRALRRRPRGRRDARGRALRAARHARGRVRALPAPARLPRAHGARKGGHAQGLRASWGVHASDPTRSLLRGVFNMRFAFGILAFVAGLALGSLAIHVAFFGAEPPLPPEGEAIEGTLLGGTTLESPIGRPFLYGQVKLTEQRGSRLGVDEWRGVFGDPVVKVQTERGVEAVELGHPSEWRVLPEFDETATLTTLRGVPLLDEVDVGEREAPFQVSVRAAREGDPIVVERGGRKARVF